MCAFVVLGLVFPYQAKILAWGTSLKWLVLCRVESKNHNSIKQCWASSFLHWLLVERASHPLLWNVSGIASPVAAVNVCS